MNYINARTINITLTITNEEIRRNLRLLGVVNADQLGYKKLSYFYWKRLKGNTGNIKKTKELLIALKILEEIDISLIKKILIEEKGSLGKKTYKSHKNVKQDNLYERMSRAFDKNQKSINITKQQKSIALKQKLKKTQIKSESNYLEEKTKYHRYRNLLNRLDHFEKRFLKEKYCNNSEFSYSNGIRFYLDFLRKYAKFFDLERESKKTVGSILTTLELPFLCNYGHYTTSTFEGIFKNYACQECKCSPSRLYSVQVKERYKKLLKEFCSELNSGIKLSSLQDKSLVWRCQNHSNHIYYANMSRRLFGRDSCQMCKTINNIQNQTQDLIIKKDFINKSFTLKCKNNTNHNYEINTKDGFHKKIECPICKRDMRRMKVNNWRTQDKQS